MGAIEGSGDAANVPDRGITPLEGAMRDPFYDSWPRGRGLRAQLVYLIDVIANLVVSALILWGIIVILLGTGR